MNHKIVILRNLFSNPKSSKVFEHGEYWMENILYEIDKRPAIIIMFACRGIK